MSRRDIGDDIGDYKQLQEELESFIQSKLPVGAGTSWEWSRPGAEPFNSIDNALVLENIYDQAMILAGARGEVDAVHDKEREDAAAAAGGAAAEHKGHPTQTNIWRDIARKAKLRLTRVRRERAPAPKSKRGEGRKAVRAKKMAAADEKRAAGMRQKMTEEKEAAMREFAEEVLMTENLGQWNDNLQKVLRYAQKPTGAKESPEAKKERVESANMAKARLWAMLFSSLRVLEKKDKMNGEEKRFHLMGTLPEPDVHPMPMADTKDARDAMKKFDDDVVAKTLMKIKTRSGEGREVASQLDAVLSEDAFLREDSNIQQLKSLAKYVRAHRVPRSGGAAPQRKGAQEKYLINLKAHRAGAEGGGGGGGGGAAEPLGVWAERHKLHLPRLATIASNVADAHRRDLRAKHAGDKLLLKMSAVQHVMNNPKSINAEGKKPKGKKGRGEVPRIGANKLFLTRHEDWKVTKAHQSKTGSDGGGHIVNRIPKTKGKGKGIYEGTRTRPSQYYKGLINAKGENEGASLGGGRRTRRRRRVAAKRRRRTRKKRRRRKRKTRRRKRKTRRRRRRTRRR